MFPVDYISYTTRTYLKTKMESLLNHSHLSILLNNRQLVTLIELCRKIDQYALAAKFEDKIKKNKTNNP
jgi:adenine-specific DNA methylase